MSPDITERLKARIEMKQNTLRKNIDDLTHEPTKIFYIGVLEGLNVTLGMIEEELEYENKGTP